MAAEYSIETFRTLEEKFYDAQLHRAMRIKRFEAGDELFYEVTGVESGDTGWVHLTVEKFIGGGFAGQVYRVRVTDIEQEDASIDGLKVGGLYAMKILVPPSQFSTFFRNFLYWVGFQGPFQLQVNPAAARAGALWQKFIRRAAKIRFGNENTIVDIHATFVDEKIGSCGELSEWVDGRTWRLEVDERMDLLKRWAKGKPVEEEKLGSPEYRAKKQFMTELVKLFHDMGAYEFARQYEWMTGKSQPNCLKRRDTNDNPSAGLVAVDFRAGLVLLPFLPMSPGDFKLILQGISRGSLVQFDRGNLAKLEMFVREHHEQFADMRTMLDELKQTERIYRDSVPDATHNHIRLLCDPKLWLTVCDSAVTSWKVRNLVDEKCEKKFRKDIFLTFAFFLVGLIPLLGKFVRRLWCRSEWRQHYWSMVTSWDYLGRAVRARMAEKIIAWHRAGRVNEKRALLLSNSFPRFLCHLPFFLLIFPRLHRFLTDADFRREKLVSIFVKPFRLYFHAPLREQWLREMVDEGQKKHMLTDDDAATILSQINEPYIQKYLISLVVHLMTLPVSEIVISLVTVIYVLTRPELNWSQAWKTAGAIFAIWQVIPISPGSLVRGFYVVGLMIKERDFKNYNIAVSLAFFRVVGYLAFPIQMTYHYPTLARFMAGHWATEAVHWVPVFGEHGALLEHWVFRLFYNWPLTIRRRMNKRAQMRATLKPRYWHIPITSIVTAAVFWAASFLYFQIKGQLPELKNIWYLTLVLPFVCGAAVTIWAGGLVLWRRIMAATVSGILVSILYTAAIPYITSDVETVAKIIMDCLWRSFVFALFATIGTIITELKLPEPNQF